MAEHSSHKQNSPEQKHQQRMQKLKNKVDDRIASAQQEKGLLLIITGNGKGKSTSGFGTVLRAVGHGLTASVVQFIKGDWDCGERNILEKCGVDFTVMATGFTWDTQDKSADIAAAQKAWQASELLLKDESIDLVLLDELTYMIAYKYLDLDKVISTIKSRPAHQHVIITGRGCHRQLIALADTVSEVQSIKHAFDDGVKAQQGIDY
ncbi:MAG: cob(I)yrinic acid a,c-diamide adenosyltransferase [Alteromonadaceae bacterium]|nr:cob(I)yrinic acid a,c-diamide adenosyltransferase [Alteromonadaceae bacterium]